MGKGIRAVRSRVDMAPRRARESFAEIASFAVVMFLLGFAALWWSSGGTELWAAAVNGGHQVLDQLGWAFGIYVPTLLGFYVLVVGEQLSDASNAGRLRRLLGVISEVGFAALIPALLLVLIYCLGTPGTIGPLFVLAPATGLLLFLTLQLGGFVVFEASVQLEDAREARNRARTRLLILTRHSRRPAWAVLLANFALTVALGCLAIGVLGSWTWLGDGAVIGLVMAEALVCLIFGSLAGVSLVTGTVFGRIYAIVLLLLMWTLTAGYTWLLVATPGATGVGAFIAATTAISGAATASAFWTVRPMPRWLVDWTLSGMVRRAAAQVAAAAYMRSGAQIEGLKTRLESDGRRGLRHRIREAWTTLIADRSPAPTARDESA